MPRSVNKQASAVDLSDLRAVAGAVYWQRGEDYFARGLAELQSADARAVQALVRGTRGYRVQLCADAQGRAAEFGCDCPLGMDGEACKHVVAAALAWTASLNGGAPPPPAPDELAVFLGKQSKKQLLAWLLKYADDFPELHDTLVFRMQASAAGDPRSLRKALSSAIGRPRFLDWRESSEYARMLDEMVGLLESLIESDPAACFDGCEYSIDRLLKVYQGCDDSGGMIGDQIATLAALHARVGALAADGKTLARSLYKRQTSDDWGFFPLQAYWPALGEQGQAAYAALVTADYDALPEQPAGRPGISGGNFEQWAAELAVVSRMEAYAKASGDVELLLRVLQRDLSSSHSYIRLVHVCREANRFREAQSWAENGLQRFPGDIQLRTLFAEELQRVGLDEEAAELHWQNFEDRPDVRRWQALKACAGAQWPARRADALALAAAKDANPGRAEATATLQVTLLMADGDLSAAVQLARVRPCDIATLESLADRCAKQWPDAAAAFYRRCVDVGLVRADAKSYKGWLAPMKKAAELMPEAERRAWLTEIRTTYKRRPKLMGLMDKHGL